MGSVSTLDHLDRNGKVFHWYVGRSTVPAIGGIQQAKAFFDPHGKGGGLYPCLDPLLYRAECMMFPCKDLRVPVPRVVGLPCCPRWTDKVCVAHVRCALCRPLILDVATVVLLLCISVWSISLAISMHVLRCLQFCFHILELIEIKPVCDTCG